MMNLDIGKTPWFKILIFFFHPTVTLQILIFILKFSSKWLIYAYLGGLFQAVKETIDKGS